MRLSCYTALCLFLLMCSCQQKPSYHPFDDNFDVAMSALIKDGAQLTRAYEDVIRYEKGETDARFRMYYDFDSLNNESATRKGFVYRLDTMEHAFYSRVHICSVGFDDMLYAKPYDMSSFYQELEKYDYQLLKDDYPEFWMTSSMNDTIKLVVYCGARETYDSVYLWREVVYEKYSAPLLGGCSGTDCL